MHKLTWFIFQMVPEFETDENHDYFITRFFIHEGFRKATEKNDLEPDAQDVLQGVPQGVPQDVLQGEEDKEKIADMISHLIRNDTKITRLDMAAKLGVTEKTIARHIKKMGNVRYVGSGYSGYWEICDED